MRKTLRTLLTLGLMLALTANVWATPITFTPDKGASSVSVSVTNSVLWPTMSGELVLSSAPFYLEDGETQRIDFFELTADGFGAGTYAVTATLAFSNPPIASTGEGHGIFGTFGGWVSGGTLYWDDTIPEYFTLTDGNKVKIDLEEGIAFVFTDTVTVHAYVTNLGGAAVPEPATIILLGAGLLGVGFSTRRRMNK